MRYTVQPGDSLSAISMKFFGTFSRWPEIYNANKSKISDPNVVQVGQVLEIPGVAEMGPSPFAPAPSSPAAPSFQISKILSNPMTALALAAGLGLVAFMIFSPKRKSA